MRVAGEALKKVKRLLPKGSTVFDIGAGHGEHAAFFKKHGYEVVTTDIKDGDALFPTSCSYYRNTYGQFDCTWASHVLEHSLDVNRFLKGAKEMTKEGGLIAITVPPRKDNLVGGHVNLFTPLSLIYNMILAGIDCSEASLLCYSYNMTVVVKKRSIELPPLNYDNGDIEILARYFPVPVKQNMNGFKYTEANW